ncbi:protein mono-ADP-ribosyltransferase PARP10-like isoform X2 [Polyodon spathula]|nr:protein mono-ADP-ribosyltransferase PARP10-like isoform X2 [Polyodon spathula]XP_041105206.1 protein mono-ADP-ribosyltransferase PARP10-like isoform X2 [Polyodon spathula]
MSENSLEERTVEVSGIPNEVEDEFLGLFFENKRRSGGGVLASLHRQGSRAVLIFEDAEVAKRVLSRGTHMLHNAKLTVRKPTPKDPGKVLLHGMNASTAKEVMELFVENVTKLDSTEYLMYPSPGRDMFLVQFQQPLSEQEFKRLADKVRKRLLDGARIEAEQVERTDSVIVEGLRSTTTEDMLALYFENKRGGGEEVRDVTMVADGMARVTFEDWEAVDRILQRSHKLDGRDLSLRPYFDFLLPGESPASPSTPNGTEEVPTDGTGHANGTGHSDGTGDLYTDTLGCDTTREDLTNNTREMYPDSPKVYSSNILLHDPVKLNLLQCSHLLQELQQGHQDFGIQIVGNGVQISGPSQLTSEQLKQRILEVLSGIAQAHLPFSTEKVLFLSRSEVQESLQKSLEQEGMLATYTVSDCAVTVTALTIGMVKQASSLLKSLLCDFTIPITTEYECMLFSDEWPKFLSSLSLCSVKVSEQGDEINVVTLRGQEEETRSKIEFFLSNPVQQESVITMEPGMLRYLQTHCHMLLADMNQVTILPLEGEDITGLRLHGQANACQAADELLRNVVASVHTRTITLQHPGVARFLVEEQGTSILNQIQTKFEVVISLERVHWVPLQTEDIFEDAKKFTPPPSFERHPSADTESLTNTDEQTNDLNRPETGLLEEAKKLISVIRKDSHELPDTASSPPGTAAAGISMDEDLYTDQLLPLSSSDNEDSLAEMEETPGLTMEGESEGAVGEDPELNYVKQLSMESLHVDGVLEEDAQLSLAIQFSMQNNSDPMDDEDELQKVLELSRKTAGQGRTSGTSELDQALVLSIQDAIKAAHTAQILVYAGYNTDLIRVDIALGKKTELKQCKETIESKCLKNLSEHHRNCMALIERKHAVDITIQGTTATVQGFKEYVLEAVPDMNKLVNYISATVPDPDILQSVQWVWYKEPSNAVPYPPKATIYIEHAWKQKQKKIDIVFDKQPCTISFEKMEEYNIASGKTLPIARKQLSSMDIYSDVTELEDLSAISSMPDIARVNEATDEFQNVVRAFYDSIKEFHNKIRIIKVEKMVNSLLYNQYKLKKASMLQTCTQADVERTLYHGTSETGMREICLHGFNRSFCGKNATVYGKGVYFAVESALSVQDQYSPPSEEGYKYVFVVKVLTGEYTKGNHEMKTAPLKENSRIPLRYHSVVDSTISPEIFVIFNDTQAYPEYLITCQKVYG